MIMKLGMEYYVLKLYKVYIKDEPEVTLTYFTSMSNFAKHLSQRLIGELIGYLCSGVRHLSIHNFKHLL